MRPAADKRTGPGWFSVFTTATLQLEDGQAPDSPRSPGARASPGMDESVHPAVRVLGALSASPDFAGNATVGKPVDERAIQPQKSSSSGCASAPPVTGACSADRPCSNHRTRSSPDYVPADWLAQLGRGNS
jgi:hypothetical protein